MADILQLIYADHDWFRRQFMLLDDADGPEQLAAVWEPLASRLDAHAQAEEEIFYPALLALRTEDDPRDETEDAIGDHNEIRDAVRDSRSEQVGSDAWWTAVTSAREENGEHLEEEEREGMATFARDATLEQRHDLAMQWEAFFARHWGGLAVDDSDRDVEDYLDDNG